MSGMEAARVKKAYHKLLLAFEQHISQGTIVEVRKVELAPTQRQHPVVAPAPFVIFHCSVRMASTAIWAPVSQHGLPPAAAAATA